MTPDQLAKKRYAEANREKYRLHARSLRENNPKQAMLNAARYRAKRQGVPFSITVDDFHIPMDCPVLGIELKRTVGMSGRTSPSLDKIIPALGYVPGNVRVISNRANTLKNDATAKELMLVAVDILSLVGTEE